MYENMLLYIRKINAKIEWHTVTRPLIVFVVVFRSKIPLYNEFELRSDHKGTNVRWMYVFKMAY
jgi:hypothetical protein